MDHHTKILKPDGSNYAYWSYWMCNCVFEKQLLDLVDGSVAKPSPKDQKFRKLLKNWEAKNAKSLSLINDFVDPSIKKSLAVFKSAKEAWSHLARMYAHSTLAEKFKLEMEMRAVSQGDRSIQELHGIMVSFWDKLTMMDPRDLSGLDSFKKYREEQRLVQLLEALRDDFEPLRRSILQRSTTPSVQKAVEELITEESRLNEELVASEQCGYCHQTGHSMLNCPEKLKNDKNKLTVKVHGASNQFGGESSSSKLDFNDQPASFEEMQRLFCSIDAQVNQEFFGESPLESGCYLPPSKRYDGYRSSNVEPMQQSCDECHQPVQASSKTSHLTPDNDDEPVRSGKNFRSTVKLKDQVQSDYFGDPGSDKDEMQRQVISSIAQVHWDLFGESPLESGCYVPPPKRYGGYRSSNVERHMQRSLEYHHPVQPPSKSSSPASHLTPALDEEDYNWSTLKILSYNVWFREDVEVHKRMESIGNIIQLHSPDVVCFQEVTPNIYDIFKQSNWWEKYDCSISDEMARKRRYFCIQLSKLPVKSFDRKPFSNSRMGRELCTAEIAVKGGRPDLIVATSHLESPQPAPPRFDQMHSEERVAQAKAALSHLLENNNNKYSSLNVIFCGDMNWDDDLDGKFPLSGRWIDAWEELKPGENGWTYDTKSNPMLHGNRPLRKRLDRFVCNLGDFKLDAIEMIGMEAIPGASYCKANRRGEMLLPVLPSDHYGLLLQVRKLQQST